MTQLMIEARHFHTATLLSGGDVFIAGGYGGVWNPNIPIPPSGMVGVTSCAARATTERFNVGSGAFTASGSMNYLRWCHTATLLQSGKVLLIGGLGGDSTAEVYDPGTGVCTVTTGNPTCSRSFGHSATLLASGKVLVAGGYTLAASGSSLGIAELYDPSTGLFTATGAMVNPRHSHSATLLPNGKVLLAMGCNGVNGCNSAEEFDPSSGTFSAVSAPNVNALGHPGILLGNNKVILPGGYPAQAEALLFDYTTGNFAATGNMANPRAAHTATLLGNGKVMVLGGIGAGFGTTTGGGMLSSGEQYDPSAGAFSAGSGLTYARAWHTSTLVSSGKILVAGGWGGPVLANFELI